MIMQETADRLGKESEEIDDCLGLEARLGRVRAVGAGGVDGVRIDQHVRIIVAARQEHHLAVSPGLNHQIRTDQDADRPTISAGTPKLIIRPRRIASQRRIGRKLFFLVNLFLDR